VITEKMLDELRDSVRERMDEPRYRHTLGVEREMRRLAELYLPNSVQIAAAAGLLHDVTKTFSEDEQLAYCAKNGIAVSGEERAAYRVLHAKTGAHFVKSHYPQFADDVILRAIERHTVADKDMDMMDILLYVADFIEEGRRYPDCIELRRAFYDGIASHEDDKVAFLYEIFVKALDLSLSELLREGRFIFLKTVEARNAALQTRIDLRGKN